MKSHSSKVYRKSLDVTKMSGFDIAAEMARHMAEFKSGRKPLDLVAARKETSPSGPQPKQSQGANHPFLRASLAAEGSSSPASSKLGDSDFDMKPRFTVGSEGNKTGLAFLRQGPRHDRWPEVIDSSPVQCSRERSSYRAGLLAGAALALALMATASAALWTFGDLPGFLEARLPEAPPSSVSTTSETGRIASPDETTIKALPAAVPAQPTPPTQIVLMVVPAPSSTTVQTSMLDTLPAISALQPDAPAFELTQLDTFHPVRSDHSGARPAASPQQMAAPSTDRPASSPTTGSTLSPFKQLAERPRLKPDLDVPQKTDLGAATAAAIHDEAPVDLPQAMPSVSKPKPFIPTATSPLPLVSRGTAASPAAPTRAEAAEQNAKTATSELSTQQTLIPLPPPIIIQSAGKVSDVVGAASVEISDQHGDASSSRDHPSPRNKRDPNSETDAGRDGGLGLAAAQPDGPSASARDGHSGSASGGGADPGSGTAGDGASGAGGGADPGSEPGGDADGGDTDGGDADGGDADGGDTDGGDTDGGDTDGGDADGGDADGGDADGGDADGGDTDGGDADGGDTDGGDTDGGNADGGDADGGDADGGDADGGGAGGGGAGGADGSAGGGGLGDALGGLGGALGGLGGN